MQEEPPDMNAPIPEPERQQLAELLDAMERHFAAGDLGQVEAACRRARALLEPLVESHPDEPELQDQLASLHYNLGTTYSKTSRLEQAEAAYLKALPIQEKVAKEHPDVAAYRNHLARCNFNLGNTYLALRRLDEAIPHFQAAQSLWERLAGDDPVTAEYRHDLARSHFNQGYVHLMARRVKEAEQCYRQAIAVWEGLIESAGPEHAYRYDLARAHFNLGLLCQDLGRSSETVSELRAALDLFEGLVGGAPDNPDYQRDLLAVCERLRVVYRALGDVDQAKKIHARVAAYRIELAGIYPESGGLLRDLVVAHLDMAAWYIDAGNRHADAEEAYREALAVAGLLVRAQPSPENEHLLACAWFDLGILYRETRRVDGAEESYRRGLAIWDRLVQLRPDDPNFRNQQAGCHNQLGIVYLDCGRAKRAETAYRRALALREEWARSHPDDGQNAVYLGGTQCNLGNAALYLWQNKEALDWYERASRTLEAALRTRISKPTEGLARQYLANARDGRQRAAARGEPPAPGWLSSATAGFRPAGPPPALADLGTPFPPESGREAFESGRYEEALTVLERFLGDHPAHGDAGFWRARALARLGRYEESLHALESLLKSQPDHVPARHDQADLLRYLGREKEALEAVDILLKNDPGSAAGWYLRGLILGNYLGGSGGEIVVFDRDRNDSAVDAFDESILLRPDFFEARLYKARALTHSCHAAQAAYRAMADALRERSEAESDELLRPQVQAFHYYFNRARESFDAALRLRPQDVEAWFDKGRLLVDLRDGFSEEAIQAYSRVTALAPGRADAWYELARLARDDREAARGYLRRAFAADAALRKRAADDFAWLSEEDLAAL
jgi:tetratricopeptide (TPR) repeat protein